MFTCKSNNPCYLPTLILTLYRKKMQDFLNDYFAMHVNSSLHPVLRLSGNKGNSLLYAVFSSQSESLTVYLSLAKRMRFTE